MFSSRIPHFPSLFIRHFSTVSPSIHRCAIVGSGPSAFYSAKYLLKEIPNSAVEFFDKDPVPFGLIRYGVAPDHPEVKLVGKEFQSILDDPRVKFHGNVEIASSNSSNDAGAVKVSLADLQSRYHSVLLAYGAQSEKTLTIHSSDSSPRTAIGSRRFVNWYNAHPDYSSARYNLNETEAIVIGQGNVAIDLARLLLGDHERLRSTDIADYAFEAIKNSKIRKVHLIGRRGAVQSAFSIAELREISSLKGIRTEIRPDEITSSLNAASNEELKARANKRKFDLISDLARRSQENSTSSSSTDKILSLRFLMKPNQFIGNELEFEKTQLSGDANNQIAVGTGIFERLPGNLVFSSIGYQSLAIDPALPFNPRSNTVINSSGRVTNSVGSPVAGLYVSGWLKRGPTGIIGTNIPDARETVAAIVEDWKAEENQSRFKSIKSDEIIPILKSESDRIVTSSDWSRIDSHELANGLLVGKNRQKLVNRFEMLKIAKS